MAQGLSCWIRDQTSVSCIGRLVLSSSSEPSGKPLKLIQCQLYLNKKQNKQKELKKILLNPQASLVTALCFFSKKSIFKKSCPLTCSTPTYNHSVTCLGLPAPPRCHKTQACRDHQEPPCSMSRRHFQSSRIGLSMASDDTAYRVHWDALFSSLRFSSEPLNSPGNSFSALSLSSVRALPHAQIHIPQTL